MKSYSLLLGARNTPSGGKRFSRGEEKTIREITFRHFPDGFTILSADGGWFDPEERRFLQEESRQILVTAKTVQALQPWCDELAAALQQKEFLIVEMGRAVTLRPRPRIRGLSPQKKSPAAGRPRPSRRADRSARG